MSTLPLLSDVDTALSGAGAMMGGAEAHGLLCGILCARGVCDFSLWREHVLGDQVLSSARLEDIDQLLSALHRTTVEQLNDALTEFYLLLPDDDDSLSERVAALAEWCQGFILGVAEGGVSQDTKLPADSDEIMQDIIQISRAGADESVQLEEEDEIDFMEIAEYVRAGVLLINDEMQPLQTNYTIQ